MSIILPTSDEARLSTLDLIHLLSAQVADSEAPTPDGSADSQGVATKLPSVQLSPELIERVETCRQALRRLTHEHEVLQSELTAQRLIRDINASKVREGIKHYWSSLTYYASNHPNAVAPMAFYGVTSGSTSKLSPARALEIAQRILKAVEEAPEAGFPVITLGGGQGLFASAVSELAEAHKVLAFAASDKSGHKRERVETREACNDLLSEVAAHLRLAFRKLLPEEMREEMRAFGYRFKVDRAAASTEDAAADEQSASDVTDASQASEESAMVAEIAPEALSSIG